MCVRCVVTVCLSLSSGDSMTMDNLRQFSTADQDNDRLTYGNCARAHKAGWWFGACRRVSGQRGRHSM